MNLRDYEHLKFELAAILRTLATWDDDVTGPWRQEVQALFARLAEDRFNLVVVGRFSRGKTSLMNALLGTDRLPMGIVPLTSVITTVGYGAAETLTVHYHGRSLPSSLSIGVLSEYVTQQYNPGNVRNVRHAEVRLPSELLRRGFFFVDTPGIASPIAANTRTTEAFLPEADAFMLVTSYESPLAAEELDLVRTAAWSGRRIFVVVNKHDLVDEDERSAVRRFVMETLGSQAGEIPHVHSVSAREALEATRSGDARRLAQSGIVELEQALVRYLVDDKRDDFVRQLCRRIEELIEHHPHREASGITARLRALAARAAPGQASRDADDETAGDELRVATDSALEPCRVCRDVGDATFRFLSRFQYDVTVDAQLRERVFRHGGLCALHTWQYAALASPQGICTGYPALLEHVSAWLCERAGDVLHEVPAARDIAGVLATSASCAVCEVRAEAERMAVATIADDLVRTGPERWTERSALCLSHVRLLLAGLHDPRLVAAVMRREALILERVAEDMRRYAIKHDAIRRDLANEDELRASSRAIEVLAGLRNVNIVSQMA